MSSTPQSLDTGRIDTHECKMTPVGDPDEIDAHTEFSCDKCGTKATPAQGVKQAKRSRKW